MHPRNLVRQAHKPIRLTVTTCCTKCLRVCCHWPTANSSTPVANVRCQAPMALPASPGQAIRIKGLLWFVFTYFSVYLIWPAFLSFRCSCRCPQLSQPAEMEETAAAAEAVVFWVRRVVKGHAWDKWVASRNHPRRNRIHRIWFLALCTRWEITAVYSSSIWGQSLGSMQKHRHTVTVRYVTFWAAACALWIHSHSS